jgi:ribose 5-phosphate isomerase
MRTRPRNSIAGTAEVELAERLERLAIVAADLVSPGMVVGLGTGSTAEAVLRELGKRVAAGLRCRGVPTSRRTETLARELGIELTTLDAVARLDLGFDGADEIDPSLDAIKGKGGALLHEKLVALSGADFVLVATTEKLVQRLGERTALPVEIVPFGWKQTAARLTDLGLTPERSNTDCGNVESDHRCRRSRPVPWHRQFGSACRSGWDRAAPGAADAVTAIRVSCRAWSPHRTSVEATRYNRHEQGE